MQETKAAGAIPPLLSHDMLARVRHPQASADLLIPIVMECNTPDDRLLANINANAATAKTWVRCTGAHNGVAVLCGSGPSLGDDIEKIRALARAGAVVFALNGAARFLAGRAIIPVYQFIADARPENVDLLGPASQHIFASQVDPVLFEAQDDAMLVHVGDDRLPQFEHHTDYAIVIGHSSVGNVAMGLAYTMGFRDIHCFGYDSSHRDDATHAFSQPMNDGEPCIALERNGKRYVASFTMRQQAEVFPAVAHELKQLGCAITVHGTGLLPDTYNAIASERDKYEALWARDEYRAVAPGEIEVGTFLDVVKPPAGARVLDFGAGTGRASVAMAAAGLNPVLVDFAANARDEAALGLSFVKHDLTERLAVQAEYGFCTDVMEHIPPGDVSKVLSNIFLAARHVYFRIDTGEDACGALIGHKLHLSVHDYDWWQRLLAHYGAVRYAENHPGHVVFYVERVNG